MAFATTKSRVVYLTEETTQGVAVAPTLGSQAVAILSDGFELNGEKELVERTVLTSSISKQIPKTGIKTATGSIGIEWKAHGTAGSQTEASLLYKSALGSVKTIATTTTTKAGNTASILEIEDADISKFAVGDIVLVKEAGKYHISPISAIDTTLGSATITLVRAGASAFSDAVVIEKSTVYKGSNSGHPYLTVTSYLDDALKIQSAGHLVASMALENFSVGQIPTINFALNGITYEETLAPSGLTASYDTATPPIALGACIYLDGVAIPVTELGFSVENTVGRITSTCSENGIISTRVTERAVTGSLTTYQETTSVGYYSKFNTNAEFSLFGFAGIPTGTAGEIKDLVAFFIPKCIITAKPIADADGIATIAIEFSAGYSDTYATDVIVASV